MVDVLRITLAGGPKTPLIRARTASVEAYNLYLKGRYHGNQRTEDGFQKAIGFFEEAIRLVPEYAPEPMDPLIFRRHLIMFRGGLPCGRSLAPPSPIRALLPPAFCHGFYCC